jgi:hypothetical protein
MVLHRYLLLVLEVVLLIVILERPAEPCDVFRHGTKGFVLPFVDTVHSTGKVRCSLLYCLSLTGLMASSLIERHEIRNIANMVVKFPITSVPIASTGLLEFRTVGRRARSGCLSVGSQKGGDGLG